MLRHTWLMNQEIIKWAIRHGVNAQALSELHQLFGIGSNLTDSDGESESAVQARVRLASARKGYRLFRNNVGVLTDKEGRPVRYGLANDSSKINKVIKSSDLIGWREVTVGNAKIAQFVSLECKHGGWQYTGTDREVAQLAWINLVNKSGGIGKFIKSEDEL